MTDKVQVHDRDFTLTGAAAVNDENAWRRSVGLVPYPVERRTIELVERRYVEARIAELKAARAAWGCSSRGVPAGGVEVEQCEEVADVCSRFDWDDRAERPAAYCLGCALERAFYGDRALRVPDLAAGADRLLAAIFPVDTADPAVLE